MFPQGIRQCDRCESPATVHLTEIRGGKKTERHLCESCAKTQFHPPTGNGDIQKLLSDFDPHKIVARTVGERGPTCPECGLTLGEFKQLGRFGCAHDYEAFGNELTGLFKKIHGATRYSGKTPDGREVRGGETQDAIRKMRRELDSAIDSENYEEAARLRDEIRSIQEADLAGPVPGHPESAPNKPDREPDREPECGPEG